MSFVDVIGRIDQIMALQQQILDPSAATSSSASSDGGASLTGTSGSGGATFATALANAQAAAAMPSTDASLQAAIDSGSTDDPTASGVDPTTSSDLASTLAGLTGTTAGTAGTAGVSSTTSGVATIGAGTTSATAAQQVQAMTEEANSLIGKPYVWGGGHSGWGAQTGYDCSGFVSAVLHAGGYLSSPQDTETLPSAAGIESGPGQYVTIYDRTTPGQEGHVIIDIGGQFYESGGESGSWGGGGGVEKISTPTAAYLATFNTILHPAGL